MTGDVQQVVVNRCLTQCGQQELASVREKERGWERNSSRSSKATVALWEWNEIDMALPAPRTHVSPEREPHCGRFHQLRAVYSSEWSCFEGTIFTSQPVKTDFSLSFSHLSCNPCHCRTLCILSIALASKTLQSNKVYCRRRNCVLLSAVDHLHLPWKGTIKTTQNGSGQRNLSEENGTIRC